MKNHVIKVLMIDSLIGNDYSLFLCSELIKQGVEVSLIITEDRKVSLEANFDLIRIMPSKDSKKSKINKFLSFPRYLSKIIILIFQGNYEIIHYQFFRFKSLESIFFAFLKMLPVKTFHTAHDVVLVNEKKISMIYNKIIYKFSDALIVHSEKNKKQLSYYYKIPSEKIYVTPHGSFDFYKDTNKINTESAKKELGIQPEQIVLLFFGFIKEYKGLDILLEAINRISDIKLTLIIAGEFESVDLKDRTLRQIKKLPLNITIINRFGFVEPEEIPIYFTVSDIVVLPYKTISHSGVLHLAYSFSKPVLVTNVGDFEESIENGKSGILIKQCNSSAVYEAIKKITEGLYDLKSMGKYAKMLNDEKYSWEMSAIKLKEVYEIFRHQKVYY